MKPSLQLRLGHQLTMTPQLQQAIRLLQLSSVDLYSEIQTALESNIMLEQDVSSSDGEETSPLPERNETPWDNLIAARSTPRFHESTGNELETLNGTQITLRDHLLWQMELTPFGEIDRFIATLLIDSINEDGFLTTSIEDIVATLAPITQSDEGEVIAVLRRIQQFDPAGVGARDLSECLHLQLAHLPASFPYREVAIELVKHYLPLLGKRDYATLKRRLGLSTDALQAVIQCIQALHPRPGTQATSITPEYIVPDVLT